MMVHSKSIYTTLKKVFHLFFILISLTLIASCSSLNSKNSDFKVTYTKSKGRISTSAHFTIKLDGTSVYYSGVANMPILGEHNFTIQKSEVKRIKDAFEKSAFSNFDKLYQGNIRDLPISSITYNNFEVRFQTKQAPKELKELALLIESTLIGLKK